MPWNEASVMSLRLEFVQLALHEGTNFSELCRRYHVHRTTGYKWLKRYKQFGIKGLEDRSRCPQTSPNKTAKKVEQRVIAVRRKHPSWGGRKIEAYLKRQGMTSPPHPNTITDILHRHGLIQLEATQSHQPYIRFEHEQPNDLWQMDFKGYLKLPTGRCYPLTVLDDCSRFSLGIQACRNEQELSTKQQLIPIFKRYGLPGAINMDNGNPWGSSTPGFYTSFAVWLMRLGIRVSFSRPRHPQTNGKIERFHRTLKGELLNHREFKNLQEAQQAFSEWRHVYNTERPHEALEMKVPVQKYESSRRPYPDLLRAIEYAPDDLVQKVTGKGVGFITVEGKRYRIGGAFCDYHVAVRPTIEADIMDVYFCAQKIKTIDLRCPDG